MAAKATTSATSSSVAWSGTSDRIGKSLIAVMVRRNELVVNPPSGSLATTNIVTGPDWLGNGVTRNVRFEPTPLKAKPASGTTVGSEESPNTSKVSGGDSRSVTVNGINPVSPSSSMIRSAISEIV